MIQLTYQPHNTGFIDCLQLSSNLQTHKKSAPDLMGCLVILTAVHRFGADFLCALALGGMLSMKQMMSRPMTYGNRIIPARVILCFAPKLL